MKAMMKKPVVKKPAMKKYAEGGIVQMHNMAGMTGGSFGPAPSMTPAQAQANMVGPAGTRAGPSAPQADAAMIQAAQQMASDKAVAKKQSQQPIPAAQRVAAFRKQQAMKASGRLGMAKGGVVAKKAVAMKGKKK